MKFNSLLVIASSLVVASTFSLAMTSVSAAESQRAFWRGQWVNFVEVGDDAVVEGDIIIGKTAAIRKLSDEMRQAMARSAQSRKALSIDFESRLWRPVAGGVAEVPFTIEAGNTAYINGAVAEVNRVLEGVVRWVPRTTQPDYVAFNMASPGVGFCASALGRSGGRQTIIGEPECGVAVLVHEMGHALGLLHVQQDADSAPFLDVKLERIEPSQRTQTASRFGTRTFNGYDYSSIMHYQRRDFSAVAGLSVFETRPAGFDLSSAGYSPGDIDALFRLYGKAPTKTTINTNPVGLKVYVDGVLTTTPATFEWPIGSVHRLWAATELQTTASGFKVGFGRWSHDTADTPSTQLTWQVQAGEGSLGSPVTVPASTSITANFVRLIEVNKTPASSAGGATTVLSRTAAWPNTANLFPQLSIFDVTATPNAGFANYAVFGSGFPFNGGLGVRGKVSLRLFANTPSQTVGELFHNGAAIAVDVVGDGMADGLNAVITSPTDGVTVDMVPRLLRTTPGTWKVSVAPTQTSSQSVRHIVDGVVGFENAATGEVVMPASGVRTVTINAHRELTPNVQVVPTCAATVVLSENKQWFRTGATLSVTVTPIAAAVLTGWSGSVSGTDKTQTLIVGETIPEFIATFNTVAQPLRLTSISPRVIGEDPNGTTVTLRGTGFTPATRVVIAGAGDVPTFVDSTTLTIKIFRNQFFDATRESIVVSNRIGSSCTVQSDAVAIDVLASGRTASVSLVEYYNAALDYYFLTGRAGDKTALDGVPAIWARTGNEIKLYAAPNVDTQPLERHYFDKVAKNASRGSHFFTALPSDQILMTSLNPSNVPLAAKPVLEGVEGYAVPAVNGVCPAGSAPIYRAFKGAPRYVDDGNHRFSNNLARHQDMVSRLGWIDDGVVFCGLQ
jgi:hypothetical protein